MIFFNSGDYGFSITFSGHFEILMHDRFSRFLIIGHNCQDDDMLSHSFLSF